MEYKNNYQERELSKNLFAQLDKQDVPITPLPQVYVGAIDYHWAYRSILDLGNVL